MPDHLDPLRSDAIPVNADSSTVAPGGDPSFESVMATLRAPKKRTMSGVILVLSLAAFVLLQQDRSPTSIAVLVGVLLFHELGHYTGMRIFGYRDVRMFFIPFFGAAVSGKARDVAPWKEGVVLLLGPLPGIVVASMVVFFRIGGLTATSSFTHTLAISLVSINAFNLLPLAGLDGARLWQHVLFSRRRWLEFAFHICAVVALGAMAIALRSVALGIFAYLILVGLPYRWRLLGNVHRLRETGVEIPADARDLHGEAGRLVFKAAIEVSGGRSKSIPATMENLVEAVHAGRPSVAASLFLGLSWFTGLVLAIMTLIGVSASS